MRPAWNAVFALALGVAGLITSEFLPVSLLTPMAHALHVSEGVAGQAISITAVVAMVASLLIAMLFGRRPVVASVLAAFWGMTFGGVQVGWPTWLTRTLPDDAESGGGLQVAITQLAIRLVPKLNAL